MPDLTSPERRTIRVEVAVDTDNLRKWADWHAEHRHPDVAHALYRSAERYDDQASALDRVRSIADELLADIPYDTDNEYARFIGQKLIDAIGGKQ